MDQCPCLASYAQTTIGRASTHYGIVSTPLGAAVAAEAVEQRGKADCNNGEGRATFFARTNNDFTEAINRNGKDNGLAPVAHL